MTIKRQHAMNTSTARNAVILTITISMILAGVFGAGDNLLASAKKPQPVIEKSNGFPSGEHFNLNIHGKKSDYNCDPSPGGKSIFVPEWGTSIIEFISNKKASLTELVAIDRCAEQFDLDPAQVQLPRENEGYWVFARILAKPNNGPNNEPSQVILYPRPDLLQLCNDDDGTGTVIDGFGEFTSCSDSNIDGVMPLGLVTNSGAFKQTEQGLERFDSTATNGKGKSKAIDITQMFIWTGYICDATLDIVAPFGDITAADVEANPVLLLLYDTNVVDGMIDAIEFQAFLDAECDFADEQWVFGLADLVIYGLEYENKGSKLVQIRFYPVDTTEFIPST